MHTEAYEWVREFRSDESDLYVLDLGGRNINGSALDHFPNADHTVLDIAPGPGVHIVADASTWTPEGEWDVVLCCEVAEHTAVWPGIVATALRSLVPGGVLIFTCAGPGRFQHSAVDGGPLRQGEWYANVSCEELADVLTDVGFVDVVTDSLGEDTRAWARKPCDLRPAADTSWLEFETL